MSCNPTRYAQYDNQVKIQRLMIPIDGLSLSVFCELANLTPPQANMVHLVEDTDRTDASSFFDDLLAVDNFGMPDVVMWGRKYGPVFYSRKGREKARKGDTVDSEEDIDDNVRERLAYVRRAAQRLLKLPFMTRNTKAGSCIPALLDHLAKGYCVIVDKDGLEDHEREMLTVMLLYHLFRHNQQLASGTEENRRSMISAVVAVEEAQYLLSKDKVADPDSIFAKIAFTGRSYKIGLLAITQRPQAIQQELLGQFDGFLVLPMEHINDFRHLADASPALSGYREDLASAPIGGGVLAFGVPKRVVSLQIDDYASKSDHLHSTP